VRAAERAFSLPSGRSVATPLLVPSFSSKGFAFSRNDDGEILSEAAGFLRSTATHLADTGAMLISAYDIYYRYLPNTNELRQDISQTEYALPALTFLDSGRYETRRGPDLDIADAPQGRAWTAEMLAATVDALDPALDAVLVNYDTGAGDGSDPEANVSFAEQLRYARDGLVPRRQRFASDCLLKPDRPHRPLEIGRLDESTAVSLRDFDIVGVAEKDLGNTVVDRLVNVCRLRDLLGRVGLANKPIHVFGALDPLYTPLYFAAGADIFDGLSWLRYAFDAELQLSLYKDAPPVLSERVLRMRDEIRQLVMQQDNLAFMRTLTSLLKQSIAGGEVDWEVFGRRGEDLDNVNRAVSAELRG
jgi:hypothetical protein